MNKKIKYLNFMVKNLLKKLKKSQFIYIIKILLAIHIFFISCDRNVSNDFTELSSKNRENLTNFFYELLLEHGGAYTLFSKKPVTIETLIYYDDEDFKKMSDYFKNHPEIQVLKVERKLEETWKEWKKLSDNFKLKNYILTEIKLDHFSEKESLLVFINIKNTALVLQKYYNDFKNIVGFHFNPLEVINALKKGEDSFWKKVLNSHALKGLLLGYGYENSWLFQWYMNDKNNVVMKNLHENSRPSDDSNPNIKSSFKINDRAFRLPIFACLDKEQSNELIQEYSRDRKLIINLYRNKNFLDVTLNQLIK